MVIVYKREIKMKYIKEIITILVIIIGGAAVIQNCKKNHHHDQVVIQHAAGASEGPGPFGWSINLYMEKPKCFYNISAFPFLLDKNYFFGASSIFLKSSFIEAKDPINADDS